jgi:uncharacterized repeat protein (TIGR03803 family)
MPAKPLIAIVISALLFTPLPSRAADPYQVLHAFIGAGGETPRAGLVFDAHGNLYGSTDTGGAYDGGTVFELTPDAGGKWTEKVLYSFCADPTSDCPDGVVPDSSLIFDSAGNLYGTTAGGGGENHLGVAFELSPTAQGGWTETVLHSFAGQGGDGTYPFGGLIFDSQGNLYGTTIYGGRFGRGTVFELSPGAGGVWTETLLHAFGFNDGGSPNAGLIFDSAGNLYGEGTSGGNPSCNCGIIFRLAPVQPGKWTYRAIHIFNTKNGENPEGGLILDAAGNLYGTTAAGGSHSGCFNGGSCGTVFELQPQPDGPWTEKVLHSFDGRDGSMPIGGVIADAAGNLYGTTAYGGSSACAPPTGCGAVFELSRNAKGQWVETLLHAFVSGQKNPFSRLVFDNAGNLYGTTFSGGIPNSDCGLGCGLAFEVEP